MQIDNVNKYNVKALFMSCRSHCHWHVMRRYEYYDIEKVAGFNHQRCKIKVTSVTFRNNVITTS